MLQLPHLTSAGFDFARKWLFGSLFRGAPGHSSRRKAKRLQRPTRLELEYLEDRTLPSASILGSVWNDLIPDGARAGGEPGLAAVVVFLDQNQNGTLDSKAVTASPDSSAIGPGGPVGTQVSPGMATLTASGLTGAIADINVHLDITKTTAGLVEVKLVGPHFDGVNVPDGPTLFFLNQGSFTGSFDEQASQSIGQATAADITGSYRPQQSFATPSAHIYEGDPNGRWGLVFLGDLTGVTLHSWSLDFIVPEANAKTDANGNYSFTGLDGGAYNVAVVLPTAATPTTAVAQAVTVGADAVRSDVNFGIRPAAALPAPAPLPVLPDQAVTNDAKTQQMPSVAVDPHDANHVVMAYMDYALLSTGYAGIAVANSIDAGTTWTRIWIPLPANFDQAAGTPTVRFGDDGRVYVSFMAATFLGKTSTGAAARPPLIYDTGSQTIDGRTVLNRALGMQANNGIFVASSANGATWNPSDV